MPVLPTATSPEEAGRAAGVALLPVGSFEQHGAHLPLTTDKLVACAISEAIAGVHAVLVLPPVAVLLLHAHPDLVRGGYQHADHVAERPHLLVHKMRGYTPTGVIGRPSLATAAKGRGVLSSLTDAFAYTQVALRLPPDARESSPAHSR